MTEEEFNEYLNLLLNMYVNAATSRISPEYLLNVGGMADLAQRERVWLSRGARGPDRFLGMPGRINEESFRERAISRGNRHIQRIADRVQDGITPHAAVRTHLETHHVRVTHNLEDIRFLMTRVLFADGGGNYRAVRWLSDWEHGRRQTQARFRQIQAMTSDSIVGAVTTLSVMTEAAISDEITLDNIPSEAFDRGIDIGTGFSAVMNAASPAADARHARRNPGRNGASDVVAAAPTHQSASASPVEHSARVGARPNTTARATRGGRAAAQERMTQRPPVRQSPQVQPSAIARRPTTTSATAQQTPRPASQRPDVARVTAIVTPQMMERRRNFIRPVEKLLRETLVRRRGSGVRPFSTQVRSAILSLWRQRNLGHRTLNDLVRRTMQEMDTRHQKVNRTPDNFIELFKMHLDAHRYLGQSRGHAALAELRQLERFSANPNVRGIDIIRQGRSRTPDYIVRLQRNNVVMNIRYEVTSTNRTYNRGVLRDILRGKLRRWSRTSNGQYVIRNQLNNGVGGFSLSFSGGVITVRFNDNVGVSAAQVRADAQSSLTLLQQTYPHLRGIHVYQRNLPLAEIP